jgi:hypothetical protein
MAVEQAHVLKAKANEDFLGTIDDRYPEWMVTVAFYKAVHLVEAVFAREGVHSQGHVDRNTRLQDYHEKLWFEFKPLGAYVTKCGCPRLITPHRIPSPASP